MARLVATANGGAGEREREREREMTAKVSTGRLNEHSKVQIHFVLNGCKRLQQAPVNKLATQPLTQDIFM